MPKHSGARGAQVDPFESLQTGLSHGFRIYWKLFNKTFSHLHKCCSLDPILCHLKCLCCAHNRLRHRILFNTTFQIIDIEFIECIHNSDSCNLCGTP